MSKFSQSPLEKVARERLAQRTAKTKTATEPTERESLVDFVVRATPKYQQPVHLKPIIDTLDEVIYGKDVMTCLSAPPRHGKSETACFHLIAKYLEEHPDHQVAYCCYSAKLAEKRSRDDIRPIVDRIGLPLDNRVKSAGYWRTKAGGGVSAKGIEGALTGFGFNLVVVDDPFRDRADAESPIIRTKAMDWFTSTAYTRLEPGASIVITHTRWHPDDMIGQVLSTDEDHLWKHINLPAIDENGKALWPERYSIEKLARIRGVVGDYDWASLYMGEPQPRGASVFNGVRTYAALPTGKLRYAVGIDLAYTSKSYSDSSVAVVLAMDEAGVCYVVDVLRLKVPTTEFIEALKGILMLYGWPPVFSYIGAIEKGVIDFFAAKGVKVEVETSRNDKFVRAQPAAAAWNNGKILLPEDAPKWRGEFVSELLRFTGLGDKHDDQVDALAGAYAKLAKPKVARGMGQSQLGWF